MQNKSNVKNWDEIKMFITAIAFTLTLLLWNMFSGQDPKKVVQQEATIIPPTPAAVASNKAVPGNVRILFGGAAPKTKIFVSAPAQNSSRNSSQSAAAPQPVTSTASSK
jgi:hypothetical protein